MSEANKPEPVLPTYDPNWEQRHDRLVEQIKSPDRSRGPQEMDRLVAEMHAAFHAQFRTTADYAAWAQKTITEQAAREGKVLAQPAPPKGATVDQIDSWGEAAYQALRRLDYPQLSVGQPPGLLFFNDAMPQGARRVQGPIALADYRGALTSRIATIEQQNGLVGICLHESMRSDFAVAPVIERVATQIHQTMFPDFDPGHLRFFLYAQPEIGGPWVGEQFVNVGMKIGRQGYHDPGIKVYERVPALLRQGNDSPAAFFAPYAPGRHAAHVTPPSPRP